MEKLEWFLFVSKKHKQGSLPKELKYHLNLYYYLWWLYWFYFTAWYTIYAIIIYNSTTAWMGGWGYRKANGFWKMLNLIWGNQKEYVSGGVRKLKSDHLSCSVHQNWAAKYGYRRQCCHIDRPPGWPGSTGIVT